MSHEIIDPATGCGAFYTDPLILAAGQRQAVEYWQNRWEEACIDLWFAGAAVDAASEREPVLANVYDTALDALDAAVQRVVTASEELQRARAGVLPDDIDVAEVENVTLD